MDFDHAMKALEAGRKIRNEYWDSYEYITLASDGEHIVDEYGKNLGPIELMRLVQSFYTRDDNWGLYHPPSTIVQLVEYGHEKIRRSEWEDDKYIEIAYDTENFVGQDNEVVMLSMNDIIATDWEPYNQ